MKFKGRGSSKTQKRMRPKSSRYKSKAAALFALTVNDKRAQQAGAPAFLDTAQT
jgi:hypothetical protein